MADLDTTKTFANGDLVDAAAMNNIIDQATVLKALITGKTVVSAAANDHVLITDFSDSDNLKSALVSTLPGGGTVTGFSADDCAPLFTTTEATVATTPALHFNLTPTGANKVLIGPVSGSGAPTYRVLTPADLPIATTAIAAGTIDCTTGNVFSKTLPTGVGPFGMTIANLADGQTIRVGIINNAVGNNKITWGVSGTTHVIIWRDGGGAPLVSQVPNGRDCFVFTMIGAFTYGYADQDFRV